ncbi:taste receptor type 2 member 140-like [Sciurus carolinensis]|uniref:taste receptor type 2 member 140-like n=1 Tax=Sciurus carolinensis TaxID=30640 RepID=UPI001FB40C79|nr:taste receptor type 2 member 140-like [Sciurus carolinensis]
MGHVIQSMFKIILSVESIIGSFGNGFIALVNCMDWVKRRKISSVDQILTALALSRIGVLWSVLTSLFVPSFYPGFSMTAKMIRMINITWTVTNHFNLWLSTNLSIFYFLKIANFSNSIFLYLKWRVKKVVFVILLMSLILLLLNIVLINIPNDVWIGGNESNMSYISSSRKFAQFSRLLSFTNCMFTSIPFTVSLLAFLLLIISLWKHLKRMQHNARRSRDASTSAHVKALQIGITFLVLYAIFFLSLVIQASGSEFQGRKLVILFCQAAGIVFPSGHSLVLILGNGKLRRASLSVLWWLRGRSKC